jgi:hypothetical protein
MSVDISDVCLPGDRMGEGMRGGGEVTAGGGGSGLAVLAGNGGGRSASKCFSTGISTGFGGGVGAVVPCVKPKPTPPNGVALPLIGSEGLSSTFSLPAGFPNEGLSRAGKRSLTGEDGLDETVFERGLTGEDGLDMTEFERPLVGEDGLEPTASFPSFGLG